MKSQFWIHLVALFTLLILPNVGYSLPLCRTDQQQVYDNCFGKYAHPEDTDAAGEFYIGEFQDDEFIGLGGYFFPDGANYFGDFKSGKASGFGTYNYSSGRVYLGEYKEWLPNGMGSLIGSEMVHVGNYEQGRREGVGLLYHEDGDLYLGILKRCQA